LHRRHLHYSGAPRLWWLGFTPLEHGYEFFTSGMLTSKTIVRHGTGWPVQKKSGVYILIT